MIYNYWYQRPCWLTVVLEVGVSQGALDTVWGRCYEGRSYRGWRRLLGPDWFRGRTAVGWLVIGGGREVGGVILWPRLFLFDQHVDCRLRPRCHGNSRARPLNTETVVSFTESKVFITLNKRVMMIVSPVWTERIRHRSSLFPRVWRLLEDEQRNRGN